MSKVHHFVIDQPAAIGRLELVRRASGLGKGKLAETLGMYPPNYSRLIKGDIFLTADQFYTVWRLYGADPSYIMDGREDGVSIGLITKIKTLDSKGASIDDRS